MKRCTSCGSDKSLDAFYADARRSDGRRARCKLCERDEKPNDLHARLCVALGLPKATASGTEILAGNSCSAELADSAAAAMEFITSHPEARQDWMHVPANGDYHCLTLHASVDGVRLKYRFGGGFPVDQARQLSANLKRAADEAGPDESLTPAPFAYAGHSVASATTRPSPTTPRAS